VETKASGWTSEEIAAPGELGGGGLEPIGDAPGTYVYDR
jgi:poly[(R)-3-hydroxyalkanoate] polymerase subunit PhaC